eukprot:2657550-Amphidinium_carterae.1
MVSRAVSQQLPANDDKSKVGGFMVGFGTPKPPLPCHHQRIPRAVYMNSYLGRVCAYKGCACLLVSLLLLAAPAIGVHLKKLQTQNTKEEAETATNIHWVYTRADNMRMEHPITAQPFQQGCTSTQSKTNGQPMPDGIAALAAKPALRVTCFLSLAPSQPNANKTLNQHVLPLSCEAQPQREQQ